MPHFYLTLCDYLTKPFERFEQKRLFRGKYKHKKEDDEQNINKEYAIPPYLTRNWTAHRLINNGHSKLDAQEVAFLFITVIQCIYDYDCLFFLKAFTHIRMLVTMS
ncbi:MAG: hypothetical protein V2I97_25485 [Desulfococcaceae bacterium]|nr:hypothetical protein [Desulfococcaceae bacterium]